MPLPSPERRIKLRRKAHKKFLRLSKDPDEATFEVSCMLEFVEDCRRAGTSTDDQATDEESGDAGPRSSSFRVISDRFPGLPK